MMPKVPPVAVGGKLIVGDFDDPVAAADRNPRKRCSIFSLEAALRDGRVGRIGRQSAPTTNSRSKCRGPPKATRAPRTDRTLRSKYLGKKLHGSDGILNDRKGSLRQGGQP